MELANDDKKFKRAPWNWMDTAMIIFFALIFAYQMLSNVKMGD